MARIFLSYRRSDGVASGARSLIFQKIEEHYGPKSVFMDVERMQVARDFRECLHEEVSTTDVMLLLIGPEWERIIVERADQESDFVRIEIETALELEKPILPLLLGGAAMPRPEVLPESIRGFAWNHGVELDTGRYFNEGMARLMADMDEHIFKGVVQYRPRPKPKVIGGVAGAALVLLVLAGLLIRNVMTTDDLADDAGKVVETTGKVAENTGKIAETTEEIRKDTARVADVIEKAAEGFAQLAKSGGVIEKPVAPYEFYHNARIYELRGDYASARTSYLGYFQFNEEKLDPYLRYLDFLKVQEGREGARETFAVVAGRAGGFLPDYASVLLWDREKRLELLEKFRVAHPEFAPVYYHLSIEYSAERLGSQSIADRREEKQYLDRFVEQDKAGQLVKHFLDQEMVTAWRNDAEARLGVANAVDQKMLENPVNLTWMNSSAGWHGNIAISEPAGEIWWKTAEMPEFKKTPLTQNIDTRTGKPRPDPGFSLPTRQPATTIEVKYSDRNGTERGPFTFEFKPKAESWADSIGILNQLPNAWLSYRDFDGKLLVYFTHLLSYRGALSRIVYGIDVEVPDQEWEFPAWDEPGVGPISDDVTVYREIPAGTRFITVRLSYKDGTESEVVKFPR